MEKNTPENVETVDITSAPADQTGKPDDTPAALTVASVALPHIEQHTGFDPAVHAVNADGSPKRKADGSYALKRGRKAGSALPAPASAASAASAAPEAAPVESAKISPDEAARQSANLVINASVWICGEEIGKPLDKAEAEGLKLSFVNYYESRGVPNIPPEIGLFAALASYIAPRLRKAEEKEGKISRMVNWCKIKYAEIVG